MLTRLGRGVLAVEAVGEGAAGVGGIEYLFGVLVGPSGGGGGSSSTNAASANVDAAGNGGTYGAGGGGGGASSNATPGTGGAAGAGGQCVIRITYTAAASRFGTAVQSAAKYKVKGGRSVSNTYHTL